MPQRIQRRRVRGWRLPENATYVGRPTKFGNPFRVGAVIERDGPLWPYAMRAEFGSAEPEELHSWPWSAVTEVIPKTAQAAVDAYGWWLVEQPELMLSLPELRGKDLACWCPLVDAEGKPVPCHADVLLELCREA